MLQLPQTVSCPVSLMVPAAADAELAGALRYEPSDPFAVSLELGTDCGEPVVWTFARELLADGVTAPAGLGDVVISPLTAQQRLSITLSTDTTVTVVLDLAAVVEFLVSTLALVPSGTELDRLDLDAEIAALLG